MNQPQPELSLLANVAGPADRFITDGAGVFGLGSLGCEPAGDGGLEAFAGLSVLLAVRSQLEAAAALIQLEGVARRLVLWPADEPEARLAAVCARAGIERVIRSWKLPINGAGLAACRAKNQDAARMRRLATQWVMLTSGTTGAPKLVVHTLESLAGHLRAPGPGAGAIWCTFYDIRRYGGLQVFLRAVLQGGSLLLAQPGQPFELLLGAASRAQATHFVGTPSHWRKVLMSPFARELHPRYVRLSGEIADQPILDKLRRAYPNADIVHAFASTEAGLAFEVTDGRAGVPPRLLEAAAGRGTAIRLVDGALQLRSPRAAQGYLRAGEIDPIADPDGFVDTGDLLELREDRLFFAGRRDDVVNIGGRKVHPARVEAVINGHPAVRNSRVLGKANPITGALVAADIVCQESAPDGPPGELPADVSALEASIRAFCRRSLEPHEVPATIRFVPSLALSSSGKLARRHA